jgi:hypothetical protein
MRESRSEEIGHRRVALVEGEEPLTEYMRKLTKHLPFAMREPARRSTRRVRL